MTRLNKSVPMQIIMASLFCFLSGNALAQQSPAHFAYAVKKINDKQYEFSITATMDKGWHIYAQVQTKEAVGTPTRIRFNKNPMILMSGKTVEKGKKETYVNKEVGIRQFHYANQVEFVQAMTLKTRIRTSISGTITFQVCTDEMCLPEKTIPFSVPIGS